MTLMSDTQDTTKEPLNEIARSAVEATLLDLWDPAPSDGAAPPPVPQTTAFAIMTRRLSRSGDQRLPFHMPDGLGDLHLRLDIADHEESLAWAQHPYPGARRVTAQMTDNGDALEVLATDDVREVRAAVAANPHSDTPTLRRLLEIDQPEWLIQDIQHRLDTGELPAPRCSECGKHRVRTPYTTCSIACSIDQANRHETEGLTAGAIGADYRHRYGFRDHWPDPYVWRCASHPPSGGLPGTGPRTRLRLLSFIPGVTAPELVEQTQRICNAGMPGPGAVSVLEKLATHVEGPEELAHIVTEVCNQPLEPEPFEQP